MSRSDENILYRDFCNKKKCTVEPSVDLALKNASVTGELDLSGHPLGIESCEGLAQIILNSINLVHLNFTDCMLSVGGLSLILEALHNNRHVKELNLYGNNITAQITMKLGKLLSINNTLKTLILKWNNIGISVDSFNIFCNGLQHNHCLETLDIRNNQLCHQAAKCLAHTLRVNKTLKTLDLRWNSIQNDGAEELLQALEDNKTICNLQLKGNFIHREILVAIEECVKNHSSVVKLHADHEAKTDILVKHIKTLEETKAKHVTKITDAANKHMQEAENRLAEVVEDCRTKQKKLDILEEELFNLRRMFKNEKQKATGLEEILQEREDTFKELSNCSQGMIEKLQKTIQEKEIEHLKHFNISQEQINHERETITTLENELAINKQMSSNLKSEMVQMKNQFDSKLKQIQERYELDKEMWQKKYQDIEKNAEAKIERTRTMALDKQQSLENTLLELTERQSNKTLLVNDRIDRMKQEKVIIEEQLSSAQAAIVQLQRENSSLIGQVAEPARKLTSLLEELSSERIQNQQLKLEKAEERRSKEEAQSELDRIKSEVFSLKTNCSSMTMRHEEDLQQYKVRYKQLQSKLEDKERKITNIRHEEKARAKLLHSAFSKYWDRYTPSSGDS